MEGLLSTGPTLSTFFISLRICTLLLQACFGNDSSDSSDKKIASLIFSLQKIVTRLKLWQNFKTSILTKLKNTNYGKTWQLKLWQNSKTPIVTKLKKSNFAKSQNKIFEKAQKLELWQNSKTQIVTKPQNSNCDTVVTVVRVGTVVTVVTLVTVMAFLNIIFLFFCFP